MFQLFKSKKFLTGALISMLLMSSFSLVAYAITEFTLSYTIDGGLSVSITDNTGTNLESLTLTSEPVSFTIGETQTSDAVLASTDGYFTVLNSNDVAEEWDLYLAPSDGSTALWATANGSHMDFNDADTGEDVDVDGDGGRLTIDLTDATLAGMFDSTTTGITVGSTASFSAVNENITLMSGANTADSPGGWGLTDVTFTQLIPESQAGGTYTLDLTLTVN
ncbi:MAG TPA: hypothetical protein PK398_01050 [Candidatus Gracilibacteria bacterium]|nr:hypothetical protein [Candidatus Gracilibacteria bacterium]